MLLLLVQAEMSELSLLNLLGSGINHITIVNRTESKARILAEKHQVSYDKLESLPSLLTSTDIVISSTSSPDYIITKSMINQALSYRKSKLLLLDICSTTRY